VKAKKDGEKNYPIIAFVTYLPIEHQARNNHLTPFFSVVVSRGDLQWFVEGRLDFSGAGGVEKNCREVALSE